jgi:SAM-dependent methyltransferase
MRLARAACAQLAGAGAAFALLEPSSSLGGLAPPGLAFAAAAGIGALLAGRLLGLAGWWRPLHLGLPILAWLGIAAAFDPRWYLLAFGASFLVFGLTPGTGVPLYLSGQEAIAALAEVLPQQRPLRVLDAGCGTGTVLAGLARRTASLQLEGVESALLPWAVARARAALGGGRFAVGLGDLWRVDLARYDVVYAFLSPEPMPRLWRKARREMRPGSLLVSNRFDVAQATPERILETGGGRRLYLWRM